MKRYNYKFPDCFYSYGFVYARNEREVRENIRRTWGYSRLPRGTEVYIA